ncbi:MAG: D-alanine--D-alanine ligase [Methyloligellaceae bacterium]
MSGSGKHVAVLLGGLSAEREVSLASGKACADALEKLDYQVSRVDVGRDIAHQLLKLKPDMCFNALHGTWGEDGCIQGILEYLEIPYTHSGVRSSALAMHKELSKTILKSAGVAVANSVVVPREVAASDHQLEPPYVAKPVSEGSSVGVVIVASRETNKLAEIAALGAPEDLLMIERFIPGRELTCGVMGDKALGVIEILPAEGLPFYDFEAKYAIGGSKHVLPAKLSPNIYQSLQKLALKAHQAIGCRGVSRTDFRFDEKSDGSADLVCLEVNTQPGMTETSLVPEMAVYEGLTFEEFVRWILEDASCCR